ncbi:MAG: hypothetical protein IH940_13890, partial [Acidobacteria bacterium]|nr:hypothetical protein [Acidobacteriota bacterium]
MTDQTKINIGRAVVVESPIEPSHATLSAIVAVSATKCGDIVGGSGFLLGDGLIVTAAHLTDNDGTIALVGAGSSITSKPARLASNSDLAVA